jgi:hypothetical protein
VFTTPFLCPATFALQKQFGLIKEIIGRYVYYIFYEYDNTGNQIGFKYYDNDKTLCFRREFIADNDDKIISVITYGEKDDIFGETKYIKYLE